MNLTGDRTTLKLNIAALALALIIYVEAAYITYHAVGRPGWEECLLGFIPLLVMFIIRDRVYSYTFFFLHLLVAIEMSFGSRAIYFGARVISKVYLPSLSLLVLASLACLAVYALWHSIAYVSGVVIRKLNAPKSS